MSSVCLKNKVILTDGDKLVYEELFDKAEEKDNYIILSKKEESGLNTVILYDSENKKEICKWNNVKFYVLHPIFNVIEVKYEDSITEIYSLAGNLIVKGDVYKCTFGGIYVRNGAKLGVYSYEGEELIPVMYDLIEHKDGCGYIVQYNGLFGIVSKKNETIVECKYKKIKSISPYVLRLKKDSGFDLFEIKTRKIIEVEAYEFEQDTYNIDYKDKEGHWHKLKF